jgi:tetratricopeptide (TPR) repeat protein
VPEINMWHWLRARYFRKTGRIGECLDDLYAAVCDPDIVSDHLLPCLARDPRDFLLHCAMGMREQPSGFQHFDRALELNPESGHVHYWRGVAFYAHGMREEELLDIRAAMFKAPKYYRPHVWMSVRLEASGDYERALAHAEEARDLNPLVPSVYKRLAAVLVKLGRRGEAMRAVKEGLTVAPHDRELLSRASGLHE